MFPLPARQATQWEIQSNAVLVELERKKGQHYEKWGVDRLITLVDIEFRTKVWAQMGRVWDALDMGDLDKLHKAVNGMCKGFDALEKWAEENDKETKGQETNPLFIDKGWFVPISSRGHLGHLSPFVPFVTVYPYISERLRTGLQPHPTRAYDDLIHGYQSLPCS